MPSIEPRPQGLPALWPQPDGTDKWLKIALTMHQLSTMDDSPGGPALTHCLAAAPEFSGTPRPLKKAGVARGGVLT